ncbi:hypothetical protein [Halomonas sp. SL1]|uniref:hypothetical protein n=1 Tax=Halomonas sp. SL1 TaxID=2137478 RepID=UPI0011B94C35|nr:hypothetical protein [Halomonas sp. SL1]
MRDMLEPAGLKKLDQGTIFNGGVSSICSGHPVMGIILSARCDISQRKVDAVAYSPVIKIETFVENVVFDKEREFYILDKMDAVNNLLLQHNPELETWVNTYGVEKVFENESSDINKKIKDKIESHFKDVGVVRELQYEGLTADNPVSRSVAKKIRSHVESLARGKVEGVFLIDHISDEISGESSPYIVNLREIRFVDMRFLEKVSEGLYSDEDTVYWGSDVYDKGEIFFYTVSRVKSPYIELLMQRFANQFVRVGVDDVDVRYITEKLGV